MIRVLNVPDNYDPKAKLHKDLIPHREDGWIHHPLVVRTEHPETRFDLNSQYERCIKQLRKAIKDKEWGSYVFIHARPYRLQALFGLVGGNPPKAKGAYGEVVKDIHATFTNLKYWQIVAAVWTDLENIWQYPDAIQELFYPENYDHSKRYQMMDTKERKAYKALPDVVTVYRGCSNNNKEGYAWTTDKKVGIWFAQRYSSAGLGGILLTARCSKSKIFALFLGRKESEAVIDPSTIKARQIKYPEPVKKTDDASNSEKALFRKLNG